MPGSWSVCGSTWQRKNSAERRNGAAREGAEAKCCAAKEACAQALGAGFAGGYRALHEVVPDTGRDDSAGDVRVLRVYGRGQDRRTL